MKEYSKQVAKLVKVAKAHRDIVRSLQEKTKRSNCAAKWYAELTKAQEKEQAAYAAVAAATGGVKRNDYWPTNIEELDHVEVFVKPIHAGEKLFLVEMHTVRSAMNGAICWESVDTPWSCSVQSEAYWCS